MICGSRWRDFNWSLIKREQSSRNAQSSLGWLVWARFKTRGRMTFRKFVFKNALYARDLQFCGAKLGLFKSDFYDVGRVEASVEIFQNIVLVLSVCSCHNLILAIAAEKRYSFKTILQKFFPRSLNFLCSLPCWP